MTTVVNIRDVWAHWNPKTQQWDSDDYIYIGRANKRYGLPGSRWSNPFKLAEDTDEARKSALKRYERWLKNQSSLLARLPELDGKILVCHCHPKPCHGDVLRKLLDEKAVLLWCGDPVQITLGGLAPEMLETNMPVSESEQKRARGNRNHATNDPDFNWQSPWLTEDGIWCYRGYGQFELLTADSEPVRHALQRLRTCSAQALNSERERLRHFLTMRRLTAER